MTLRRSGNTARSSKNRCSRRPQAGEHLTRERCSGGSNTPRGTRTAPEGHPEHHSSKRQKQSGADATAADAPPRRRRRPVNPQKAAARRRSRRRCYWMRHGVLPGEGAWHRRHDRRSQEYSGSGVGQRRRLPGARLERRLAYTRNDASSASISTRRSPRISKSTAPPIIED